MMIAFIDVALLPFGIQSKKLMANIASGTI